MKFIIIRCVFQKLCCMFGVVEIFDINLFSLFGKILTPVSEKAFMFA